MCHALRLLTLTASKLGIGRYKKINTPLKARLLYPGHLVRFSTNGNIGRYVHKYISGNEIRL